MSKWPAAVAHDHQQWWKSTEFVHNFMHRLEKLPCIFSGYFAQNDMFHPTIPAPKIAYEVYRSIMGQRSIKAACYGTISLKN